MIVQQVVQDLSHNTQRAWEKLKLIHPREKFLQVYHLPQQESTTVLAWALVKKITKERTFWKILNYLRYLRI